MIEFKRDENGILIAYKNGKKVGKVITMGDKIDDKPKQNKKEWLYGKRY